VELISSDHFHGVVHQTGIDKLSNRSKFLFLECRQSIW